MLLNLIPWFLVLIIKDTSGESLRECDSNRAIVRREGNLGAIGMFPWLGVIKVRLRQETSYKIALTGIVFIKTGYAIGNAIDITKISHRVFVEDSVAMFIPRGQPAWFCRLVDYMVPAGYEPGSKASVALIELDPGHKPFPIKPICWPSYAYNASNMLFVMGYTDENNELEKVVYKMQYLEDSLCHEFYNRSGLLEARTEDQGGSPHYECAYTQTYKENCVWDNGMALVSNASGPWTLLGLVLHGPGCAVPSRYISVLPFFPWIEASTSAATSARKSAFGTGFRPRAEAAGGEGSHEVSLHAVAAGALRMRNTSAAHEYALPHAKHEELAAMYHAALLDLNKIFQLQRLNSAEIVIRKYNNSGHYGNCHDKYLSVAYKDVIEVTNRGALRKRGQEPFKQVLRYKISLYDLYYMNFTCIRVKAIDGEAKDIYLRYQPGLQVDDLFRDNPEDIVKVFPYTPLENIAKERMMYYIREDVNVYNFSSFELYMKFEFAYIGRVTVVVLGPRHPPTATSPPETSTKWRWKPTTEYPYWTPRPPKDGPTIWEKFLDVMNTVGNWFVNVFGRRRRFYDLFGSGINFFDRAFNRPNVDAHTSNIQAMFRVDGTTVKALGTRPKLSLFGLLFIPVIL